MSAAVANEEFAEALAQRLLERPPVEAVWEAGRVLMRCHHNRWGPLDFHPGQGRFSPLVPGRSARPPSPVPVLYAAGDEIGALSETVFRDLLTSGVRRLPRRQVVQLDLSTLVSRRQLRLADLTGHGLARIGLRRRDMIDCGRRNWPRTRVLAQAVHAHSADYDGMLWVSRQHDLSLAMCLFSDRIDRLEMDTSGDVPTFPLAFGRGRELIDDIADRLGIDIVEP